MDERFRRMKMKFTEPIAIRLFREIVLSRMSALPLQIMLVAGETELLTIGLVPRLLVTQATLWWHHLEVIPFEFEKTSDDTYLTLQSESFLVSEAS